MTDTPNGIFIIQIQDGEARICRATKRSRNMYKAFSPCNLGDIPIPEVQVGAELVTLIDDKCSITLEGCQRVPCCNEETQEEWEELRIRIVPIEPPSGVEYLGTLPIGIPFVFGNIPFIMGKDGIHWFNGSLCGVWTWDGRGSGEDDWRRNAWVLESTAETIKPWTPDEA